uniref:3-demethylubiquinol 3-O-methyltransferase n=1 Tax=Vannella robusta TaxID=1487602 RepID=A0A7S4MR96_9EUKA|mmetsp:Transcript_7775/g.9631  ORF Transcript_7775/g.9631 Transcript_7775/m.9631 type:complete len:337 (+) Transcript_7775:37-1047(+)
MPGVIGGAVIGTTALAGLVGMRILSRYAYLRCYANPDRSESLSKEEKEKQKEMVSKIWKSVDNGMYDEKAEEWWNVSSPFSSGLHAMTRMRAPYFLKHATKALNWTDAQKKAEQLNIVDVGCGGGILAEALVRSALREHQYKNIQLQGIDLAKGAIRVAQEHSEKFKEEIPQGCQVRFDYKVEDACSLADSIPESSVDIVVAADVLEHVLDAEAVVQNVSRVLKPGGVFVFDTINRTFSSYVTSIFLAQELPFGLSLLPSHTHEWGMFMKPEELQSLCKASGMEVFAMNGFRPQLDAALVKGVINRSLFHKANFVLNDDLSSQYIGCAQKTNKRVD